MQRTLRDVVPSTDYLIETTSSKKHYCMGEVFTLEAFWEKGQSYHEAGKSLDVWTGGCGF